MQKLTWVLVFVFALALVACGGGKKTEGDGSKCGGGGCGEAKCGEAKCGEAKCGEPACGENKCNASGDGGGFDMTQMMIDNIKECSYWVELHKEPKSGQYWEVSTTAGGQTSVSKWQVAAAAGDLNKDWAGLWIVEQYMAPMAGVEYVMAYAVDPSVEMDAKAPKANVKKGWIGKINGKPKELTVMAVPAPVEPTGEPGKEPIVEDFEVEIAGKKWTGKMYTMTMDVGGSTMTSKTWIADNGWFNRIVKSTTDGSYPMEMVLTKVGEDGKPWLSWN